jgi:hypothetical protein
MNKKSLIQLAVITGCFLISGLVIYNGFFKNKAPSGPTGGPGSHAAITPGGQVSSSGAAAASGILPYGNSLDFDKVLKKRPFEFGLQQYPKLNPQAEVGIDERNIVRPLPGF